MAEAGGSFDVEVEMTVLHEDIVSLYIMKKLALIRTEENNFLPGSTTWRLYIGMPNGLISEMHARRMSLANF